MRDALGCYECRRHFGGGSPPPSPPPAATPQPADVDVTADLARIRRRRSRANTILSGSLGAPFTPSDTMTQGDRAGLARLGA